MVLQLYPEVLGKSCLTLWFFASYKSTAHGIEFRGSYRLLTTVCVCVLGWRASCSCFSKYIIGLTELFTWSKTGLKKYYANRFEGAGFGAAHSMVTGLCSGCSASDPVPY